MKRIISAFIILAVVMSQVIIVSADGFSVKQASVKYSDGQCKINVATPFFEGFKGADEINRLLRNKVTDSIGQANSTAKYMKKLDEEISAKEGKTVTHYVSLDTTYDYSKSGDILSLQFNTYYYSGGAHPTNWVDPITANMSTGEIYTLESLFKENSGYADYITNHIISAIEKSPQYYFGSYAKTISEKKGNYNFYIDGNYLIIYFGLYDIAPYAAGIRRFAFSAEDLKDILKDEVYNSIKDSKPLGKIRLNGNDTGIENTCLSGPKGTMVPLRAVAGSLGYIIGWNEEEGATVAGGSIKEGNASYWTYGKEPVSLGEPVVQDGITYVPLSYFRDVLEENVSLGYMNYTYISGISDEETENSENFLIRMYDRNTCQDNFSRLIQSFEYMQSDEDCVKAYAEAVKNRNGAVQYGLYTDKLRAEKYKDLSERNFVTGVSSPWVESYDILKTGDNLYKITFHLTTSAKDKWEYTADLSLESSRESWRISSVSGNDDF